MNITESAVLCDRLFLGSMKEQRRLIVVGGGPSAREVARCGGEKDVILVNDAVFAPDAEWLRRRAVAGVILDASCAMNNIKEIIRNAEFPVFVGDSEDSHAMAHLLMRCNIWQLDGNYTEGLGDSFGKFANGGNSVYAAAQLAFLLGAEVIGVMGCDGMMGGGRDHWYNSKTLTVANGVLETWRGGLRRLRASMAASGVQFVLIGDGIRENSLEFDVVTVQEWCLGGSVLSVQASSTPWSGGGRVAARVPSRCFSGACNVADPLRYEPVPASQEAARGYCIAKTWVDLDIDRGLVELRAAGEDVGLMCGIGKDSRKLLEIAARHGGAGRCVKVNGCVTRHEAIVLARAWEALLCVDRFVEGPTGWSILATLTEVRE